MSLLLAQGTRPTNLRVKTLGVGEDPVLIGEYEISMLDFLAAAEYVLTNTDLRPGDPRLKFVRRVSAMRRVEGYHAAKERLS